MPEIWISDGLLFYEIDRPAEKLLEGIFKIEEIGEIIVNFAFLEYNDKINIAFAVEMLRKDGSEYVQSVHLVLYA